MEIRLIEIETTDSTSVEVQRRIDSGQETLPFAVFALEQSSGKGRRGNQWQSPRGNLYLSLALPANGLKLEHVGLLPLKCASLVSWWLAVNYQLRITLKWPNDLLFAGQKLGGILSETSSKSGILGNIVVGIGINLNVAPELADGSYHSTSLKNILRLNEDLNPAKCAHSLVRFFEQHWKTVDITESLDDYRHFAIEPGQLWIKNASWSEIYQTDSISASGQLNLKSISPGHEALSLSSTDDSVKWIYSLGKKFDDAMPICVADVGNSRTKLAYFARASDHEPVLLVSAESDAQIKGWCDEALLQLNAAGLPRGFSWPVHIISVNSERESGLRGALGPEFIPVSVPHRPVRYRGNYQVAMMGQDRLALIESYLARNSGLPAVLVSAGTATTVDFIDAEGVHLGGWIAAGIQSSLDSLAENADALPALRFRESVAESGGRIPWGLDTAGAMTEGAFEAAVGLCLRGRILLARHIGAKPSSISIHISGGFGALISAEVEGSVFSASTVLDGVRRLVIGG
jgi:biotin-[acetyl-CoA-carboxylase] ligase BirA-like protein